MLHNNGGQPFVCNDRRVKQHVLDDAPGWVGPLKAMACQRAGGDLLLELDHDDMLTPTAVAAVKAAFADERVGFVYSNTIHANEDLSRRERFDECYGWRYRDVSFNGFPLDEHVAFEPNPDSLSRIWFAPNHLRAFRRSAYDRVGGYAKDMRVLDDHDLMCRLYKDSEFKHIDKGLYVYRVHGQNTWLKHNQEIQDNVYRMHDKYAQELAVTWAQRNGLRCLELGGAIAAHGGFETVDKHDANVCCDLDERWPFEDGSVGVIRAFDVFEHLRDSVHTMRECHRVLAPGGWAFVQVPSTDGRGAFQDPTHRSFWNENSWLYYANRNWAKYINTPVRFQAPRVYTTEKDKRGVCWTVAHLICLKDGYRPPGLVEI